MFLIKRNSDYKNTLTSEECFKAAKVERKVKTTTQSSEFTPRCRVIPVEMTERADIRDSIIF